MVSLSAVLVAMAALSAPAPDSLEPLPTLRHLDLQATVDVAEASLTGTATLTLINRGSRPIATIPLLLNRLLRVEQVDNGTGMPLAWHQRLAEFEDFAAWQVRAVMVRPQVPLQPGGSTRVRVHYAGAIAPYTETGMQYVRDHVDPDFTILRADALAFPVVGSLSLARNRRATRADFTFATEVTVPRGLTVANAGAPGTRTEQGNAVTWRYRSTAPVPFLLIAIAPYQRLTDGGVTTFAFPADTGGARQLLAAANEAMDRFATWFGPLPSAARVTVIEIPSGWGSQASATGGIIQTAEAFGDPDQLPQLYHELSHLWNAHDVDLPSARWNEGLAMWLQYRMAREISAGYNADSALSVRLDRLRRAVASDTSWSTTPMLRFGDAGLTDRSYTLGAIGFALMNATLGDEEFFRRYRNYLQAHWQSGATFGGMLDALGRGAPTAVTQVADDWFRSTDWVRLVRGGDDLAALRARYAPEHAPQPGPPDTQGDPGRGGGIL